MSDQFCIPPYCDFHAAGEEVASAVCFTHQKLMCHSCSIEKARSSESCVIRPLSKVADEKDKVMVEYLQLKQNIYKKRSILKEGEKKTLTIKDDLKKEINDMYEELNKHLYNLKENCLKSVDEMTDDVTKNINQQNASLDAFENELKEYLEKSPSTANEDNTESETKIMEKKSVFIKELCGLSPDPKGHFQPNTELRDAILKTDKGLGEVSIEVGSEDLYDEVDQTDTKEQCMKVREENNLQCISNSNKDIRMITNSPRPQNVSTHSEDNSPTLPGGTVHNMTYMESTTMRNDERNNPKDMPVQSDESSTAPDGKRHRDSKHKKHHFHLPKFFTKHEMPDATGKKKYIRNKSEKDISDIPDSRPQKRPPAYEDVTFDTHRKIEPKYLINKSVSIKDLQTKSSHCWKFSKVIAMENHRVVLLSKPNSTIVIAELDGSVACQKQFKGEIAGVAVTGCDQLAILLEKRTEVVRVDVAKNGLHKKSSFHVQEMILNITGFDFYEKESQYAVSSPKKLTILDTDGLNIRTVSLDVSDYTEIVTTYDFENNNLYVLNIQHQTLKCFSYEKSDAVWRRKFEGKELVPRSLLLYQGKLYITFLDAIAVFAATDGNALDKHGTSDLLKDCLGLCVMDDVVVFSSNSDEDDDSVKLAFIPLYTSF